MEHNLLGHQNNKQETNRPEWIENGMDKAGIPHRAFQEETPFDGEAPPADEVPPVFETLLDIEEKVHIPVRERAKEAAPTAKTPSTASGNAENADDKQGDIVVKIKADRRLLPHVPPRGNVRSNTDQRGKEEETTKRKRSVLNPSLPKHYGVRYEAVFPVSVQCTMPTGTTYRFSCESRDISTNGIQLHLVNERQLALLTEAQRVILRFRVEPGVMPEGYEMRVRVNARHVIHNRAPDGGLLCGMKFKKSLVDYAYKRRGRNLRGIAIIFLGVMSLAIILMRVQGMHLLFTNKFAYIYSLVTATYLLTRYLFGSFYKPVPVNPSYTPGVSIVIPCYDEEEWIERTILSCLDQDYPPDKLEVIVIDDHSRDNSPQRIEETLRKLAQMDELYDTVNRVRYARQEQNLGKRDAMARGTRMARHDLVVFVDSDSFLDPHAIINIVQPFQDPKVGGVSGRTDIANSYTNWLTKIQSVKYYISFRIMKAVEGYFNAVTCLSGPLSCYRKEALEKNLDAWLNQRFFGRKATFGDDRSMTNFILREYRTDYQDTAICSTIAPNTTKLFLRQQMRWKRSWLRESAIAASFIWKKEPFMAVSFYVGFIIPIIAPFIVFYNLLVVPIFYGRLPYTFMAGLLAMSMLMSMTQMLMRRSKLWLFGVVYQLYYIAVLLWQMPIAWVTFWKTTWGTRMTTSDLRAMMRRGRRKGAQRTGRAYMEEG